MNNLLNFEYNNMQVRTLLIDDQNWFVATDICDHLGYANPSDVISRLLEDDERSMVSIGRQGKTNIINESGLYTLIFRSQKPEAKPFRKWVTSEVLPAIRKTGSYQVPAHTPLIVNELQAELLKANRIWAGIYRYKNLSLNHVEIGKLLDMSTDRIRRHVRRMESMGLLVPAPNLRQKQRQAAHLIAHKHTH